MVLMWAEKRVLSTLMKSHTHMNACTKAHTHNLNSERLPPAYRMDRFLRSFAGHSLTGSATVLTIHPAYFTNEVEIE